MRSVNSPVATSKIRQFAWRQQAVLSASVFARVIMQERKAQESTIEGVFNPI